MTTRIRMDIKKIHIKVFVCLVLVSLLPFFVSLLTLSPVEKELSNLSENQKELFSKYSAVYNTNLNLEKNLKANQEDHNRLHQLNQAHAALLEMITALIPLVSGKEKEGLQTDVSVNTVLQSKLEVFTQTALLHPASENILLLGSNQPGGPTKQVLPELYTARKSGDNHTPSLSLSKWYWLQLGKSEYQLAVRLPEVDTKTTLNENWTQSPGLDRHNAAINKPDNTRGVFNSTTVIMPILIGLLFAIAVFLWFRTNLLLPIDNITRDTRKYLENPSDPDLNPYRKAGFLKDLSSNLMQYYDRNKRLENMDQQLDDIRHTSNHICDVLNRASKGDFGVRAIVRYGECEEIAAATNRMLDMLAEKLKALHEAGQHLHDSAKHLEQLSDQFSKTMLAVDIMPPPADPGLPVGLLKTDTETLCHQTQTLIDTITDKSLDLSATKDKDTQISPLASASGGLRLLAQQAQEIRSSIEQIDKLHQETELLTTNMAIATEARSWSQIERMVEKTRILSGRLYNLFGSLSRDLKELALMGKTLEEITQQASDLYHKRTAQLQTFQELQNSIQPFKQPLLRQIEVIRTEIKSLSEDHNQLSTDKIRQNDTLLQGQKIVFQICKSTSALADGANQIVLQIKEMKIDQPTPAAWTKELTKSHRTLEQAICELTELASQEGIHVLRNDTQTILDNIRAAAEQAQHRLYTIDDKEEEPEPTQPETGA